MSVKTINLSVDISEADNRWCVFGVCANLKTVGDLGIYVQSHEHNASPSYGECFNGELESALPQQ
jgi:hypothetical protein